MAGDCRPPASPSTSSRIANRPAQEELHGNERGHATRGWRYTPMIMVVLDRGQTGKSAMTKQLNRTARVSTGSTSLSFVGVHAHSETEDIRVMPVTKHGWPAK